VSRPPLPSRAAGSVSAGSRADGGFSLLELLVVLVISVAVLSIGLGGFNVALDTVRGDASMNKVLWQLKLAREMAINQRRAIELRVTPPNFLSIVRRNIPSGETVVSTAVLENRTQFLRFAGLPDTPDGFGGTGAINLGQATAVMFNAEGQLVDQTGTIANISIFIGRPSAPMTARALTVFGPTSSIRTYRWNGSAWGN
jgi:prepilin-type N-terminal cleavage/methylation domain-containing protein